MTSDPKCKEGSIYLRPLVEADFDERYVSWFLDPKVTRFLDARGISREDAVDHLRQGRDNGLWHMYAICLIDNDRHVGNVKIGPIHSRHRTSDLVTVIGDRAAWGKGFAREAIGLAIRLAFSEFGVRKLSASIDSLNVGSLRAYMAAGFEVEAVLKDQFMAIEDGRPVHSDKVFVGCINPEFTPETVAAQ